MSKKYILELNEAQATVLMRAVELGGRIHMGQLDEIANYSFIGTLPTEKFLELKKGLEALNPLVTGMQNKGAHWGISSPQISEEARILFDIYQVVRHKLAWDRNPKGDITVNFDEPRKLSFQPLPKIKDNRKEKEKCPSKKP